MACFTLSAFQKRVEHNREEHLRLYIKSPSCKFRNKFTALKVDNKPICLQLIFAVPKRCLGISEQISPGSWFGNSFTDRDSGQRVGHREFSLT